MSRMKEALVFRTDEERMEWFQSLSPDEQSEIAKEAKEIVDNFIEAFRPISEALERVLGLASGRETTETPARESQRLDII